MGSNLRAIFCILLVSTVVYSNECRKTYARLTDQQNRALDKTSHSVQVLEGEVNGKIRTVVLLGEVHVQNKTTADAAKAVINAFPQRGVEGYPGSFLWKGYKNLAYFVEGLFTGSLGGSSISYSKLQKEFLPKVKNLVKKYGLEEKTAEELDAFRYRHRNAVFNGRDLLQMASIAEEVMSIPLEKGYHPTISDRAASWLIPSVYLADRLWFAPAAVGAATALAGEPMLGATIAATSPLALAVGTGFKLHWSDSGVAPKMSDRREDAMTNSILRHFNEEEDRQVLLVIVGRNHLGGMMRRLESAGFQWSHRVAAPSSKSE